MKQLLAILLILFSSLAKSQQDSIQSPHLRFPDVPPFQLLSTDSSAIITKNNLTPGQPLLLMFFSPDCDHCKLQMEFILKEIDSFKNVQIVLATYQPFAQMKDFYEKYKLKDHSNIYLGRDIKYFLPPFYSIHKLPFLALYNSNGKLIMTYQAGATAATLAKAFRG